MSDLGFGLIFGVIFGLLVAVLLNPWVNAQSLRNLNEIRDVLKRSQDET